MATLLLLLVAQGGKVVPEVFVLGINAGVLASAIFSFDETGELVCSRAGARLQVLTKSCGVDAGLSGELRFSQLDQG